MDRKLTPENATNPDWWVEPQDSPLTTLSMLFAMSLAMMTLCGHSIWYAVAGAGVAVFVAPFLTRRRDDAQDTRQDR